MPEFRTSAPTITDVARRAGVSKGLVSFVFNGRPGVAAATRARILRAADDLRWRPSPYARTLSRQMAFAIGLVIRRQPAVLASDPFFPGFLAGVETVLGEAGRVLVLSVVPDVDAEVRTYRSLVDNRRVDGVLLTDLRRDDRRFDLLSDLRLPAVSLGKATDATASVCVDDTAGIGQAVNHLIDLGHTRIAHVAGDPSMMHGWRRRVAFQAAMAARGLDPGIIVDTDFSATAGAAATRSLLRRRRRPTAIVYASDPMAIAGLGALTKRGVDVPAEMSLTGYDGTELAQHVHPPLTTVQTDPAKWGAAAARTLLTLVIDGRADHLDLPAGRLVPGRSTAQPPPPVPL